VDVPVDPGGLYRGPHPLCRLLFCAGGGPESARRSVRLLFMGGKIFREVKLLEMCSWHPYRQDFRHRDPPIRCDLLLHRSFASFIANQLLDSAAVQQRRTRLWGVDVGIFGIADVRWRALHSKDMADGADMFVFDSWKDHGYLWVLQPEYVGPISHRRIVFLLQGPCQEDAYPHLAWISLVTYGFIEIDTTEVAVAVADGWTLDERFPATMGRLRPFLRELGIEDDTVGPLSA